MYCERDDKQTNEFLGQRQQLDHVLEQDVVNAHVPQCCNILSIYANQYLLHSLPYHTMTSSSMQGLPFHTPVYNTSIACEQVGGCVMR